MGLGERTQGDTTMTARTLTFGLILTLMTAGSAFAQNNSQPVDAPSLEPVVSATQADSTGCNQAAADTQETNASQAEASQPDVTEVGISLQESAMVMVTSGSFCESWGYAGCCGNGQKKYTRVCFDASGNRSWETKCQGTCPF